MNKGSWLDNLDLSPIKDADELAIEIGVNVSEARLVAGLTQKELAEEMGTRQPSIARVESGSTLPSFSYLLRIAEALKTNLVAPTFQNIVREKDAVINVTYNFPPINLFESGAAYRNVRKLVVSSLSTGNTVNA